MQGNLSQINLNDILLLATGGKKSGLLRLSRGKETVDVYITEGEIVHAACPIGEGEKALLYPVTWGEGTFALLSNGDPPARTIEKQSSQILEEIKAMSQEWEEILRVIPSPRTVFRIADVGEDHQGPITVPHAGWRVLSKIDGMRTVQEISEILRLPYAYTAKVIFTLHNSKLTEIVFQSPKTANDLVPAAFFSRVTNILTEFMGPMASLVVQDQIAALAESKEHFPESKLDEFIGLVRMEIADEKLQQRFNYMVAEEISSFKTL